MSKQRIASNLLIMATGNVVTWGISLVQLILISRYLGPSRQGELRLAWSIAALFGLIIGLGMTTLITRSVARTPERAAGLAATAMIVRGTLAIPAFVILVVYVNAVHLNPETRLAAYLMAAGVAVDLLWTILQATFQGREQMSVSTTMTVLENLLGVGFVALIIWRRGGVVAFAASNVLVSIVLLGVSLRWIRRTTHLDWHGWRDNVREVVVGSLSFWASSIFLTVYEYIDSVILGLLAGTTAVGYYAPATRIFSIAIFVPGIVGGATLPLLSRLGADAGEDFSRVGRKTLSLLLTCAVPLTIGLATFAGPLVQIVYGSLYRPSAPVLAVLSLCLVPMFVNMQCGQMLIACNKQWRWTVIMAVSCVVNPLINAMLIPYAAQHWHNAALGAAWSLLATEVLMSLYGASILRKSLLDRHIIRTSAGALIAGLCQIAALWLSAALWSPLAEVIAAAVYVVVAIALGTLPREDVSLLWSLAIRYPGKLLPRTQP